MRWRATIGWGVSLGGGIGGFRDAIPLHPLLPLRHPFGLVPGTAGPRPQVPRDGVFTSPCTRSGAGGRNSGCGATGGRPKGDAAPRR